jgi:hypothetical protein
MAFCLWRDRKKNLATKGRHPLKGEVYRVVAGAVQYGESAGLLDEMKPLVIYERDGELRYVCILACSPRLGHLFGFGSLLCWANLVGWYLRKQGQLLAVLSAGVCRESGLWDSNDGNNFYPEGF